MGADGAVRNTWGLAASLPPPHVQTPLSSVSQTCLGSLFHIQIPAPTLQLNRPVFRGGQEVSVCEAVFSDPSPLSNEEDVSWALHRSQ